MSEKRTFVDRETGEEIESTALAGSLSMLPCFGILGGAGLACRLVLLGGDIRAWLHECAYVVPCATVLALLLGYVEPGMFHGKCGLCRRTRNAIARWQHRRRKARSDASSDA